MRSPIWAMGGGETSERWKPEWRCCSRSRTSSILPRRWTPEPPPCCSYGRTCGPHRSAPPSVTLVVSWSPVDASRPKRFWPLPRPTPTPKKEPDMPLARRRLRRTAAVVGGAAVVAYGVNRRGDRREDRRDDRGDRRDDRRDRRR